MFSRLQLQGCDLGRCHACKILEAVLKLPSSLFGDMWVNSEKSVGGQEYVRKYYSSMKLNVSWLILVVQVWSEKSEGSDQKVNCVRDMECNRTEYNIILYLYIRYVLVLYWVVWVGHCVVRDSDVNYNDYAERFKSLSDSISIVEYYGNSQDAYYTVS